MGARNLVTAADMPDAKKVQHWYYLAGVEIESAPDAAAVVTLGDSITDGSASTLNGNDRWPDVLAARLQAGAAARRWSVLNEGIGGNHMLTDGVGPNGLARLDRDVLAQPGVRVLIVHEGVNDLGGWTRNGPISKQEHEVFVAALIASYEQVIERAHARGPVCHRHDHPRLPGRRELSSGCREPGGLAAGERLDSTAGTFRCSGRSG